MKIISYYENDKKFVLVTEKLVNKDEVNEFIHEVNGLNSKLEIMFLNLDNIPKEIVDALIMISKNYSSSNFRIVTISEVLSYYMLNMSIKNTYLRNSMKDFNDFRYDDRLDDNKVKLFLCDMYQTYGYDFSSYKFGNVSTSIKTAMKKCNLYEFDKFALEVLNNEDVFKILFREISVNVTSFFRDPQVYKYLKEEILPYLNSFHSIRIWSAGTSTGEEAFSLAILLEEMNMLEKSVIYATDFNNNVIENAKNAIYSLNIINDVIQNYKLIGCNGDLLEYFNLSNNYIEVISKIKRHVIFCNHNLVSDNVFNEFHLILCRNVLIYFNANLQNKALRLFDESLHRNGFLVLGKSENITYKHDVDKFKPYEDKFNIYKKQI